MFHDTGYSSSNDTLQVVVSTNGGTTWTGVGTVYARYGTLGWTLNTVDLSAYSSQTSLLVGFNAVSAYGNDIHIDNVLVGTPPSCVAQSGGLLSGNVYDDNTNASLNGAVVQPAGTAPIISGPAADPVLGEGFYYGFIPAGSPTAVQASMMGGYGVDSTSLTVANNSALWHDFYLPAGVLTATPDILCSNPDHGYHGYPNANPG